MIKIIDVRYCSIDGTGGVPNEAILVVEGVMDGEKVYCICSYVDECDGSTLVYLGGETLRDAWEASDAKNLIDMSEEALEALKAAAYVHAEIDDKGNMAGDIDKKYADLINFACEMLMKCVNGVD